MPTSAVGSKRCAVSSMTSRAQAAISVSPGSRWPAGWLRTSLPSMFSSTKRNRPSRSMTAATVTLGFQTDITFACGSGGFPLFFLEEARHPRAARLDRLVGRRIREADVLALAGHARAEMDIGEHGNARLVQQPLPELLGVGGADHAA